MTDIVVMVMKCSDGVNAVCGEGWVASINNISRAGRGKKYEGGYVIIRQMMHVPRPNGGGIMKRRHCIWHVGIVHRWIL